MHKRLLFNRWPHRQAISTHLALHSKCIAKLYIRMHISLSFIIVSYETGQIFFSYCEKRMQQARQSKKAHTHKYKYELNATIEHSSTCMPWCLPVHSLCKVNFLLPFPVAFLCVPSKKNGHKNAVR